MRLTSGGGGNTDELVTISYADKTAAINALKTHFTNKDYPYLDIAKGNISCRILYSILLKLLYNIVMVLKIFGKSLRLKSIECLLYNKELLISRILTEK